MKAKKSKGFLSNVVYLVGVLTYSEAGDWGKKKYPHPPL